jgi:hypothetical protein
MSVIENGDETMPYAKPPFLNHYVTTKVFSEQMVLEANGDGLLTGAIRPTGGIFGPRDNVSYTKFERLANYVRSF